MNSKKQQPRIRKTLLRVLAAFASCVIAIGFGSQIALAESDHDHGHDSDRAAHSDHADHDGHDGHRENESPARDDGSHDAHEDHGETVKLTPAEMKEFDVIVASAGRGRISTYVDLPGEVRPNADRFAHIVPRYAGIVREVRKKIGDKVITGDVLAIIESSESLTRYQLKTQLDGTIISKHVTRGEAVTRETQAYIIADLTTVWIELSVYQRDLSRVAVGQNVLISTGHHLPDVPGTVSYVSPVVDEHTRTALARVVLDNTSGAWRPGMFVTGRVAIEEVNVPIAVPTTAIQTSDGKRVVFVEDQEGFTPRQVELGRSSASHAEVVSGLALGERYVASGGFILKAELGRSELGHGHAH